jgi:hypothetical protein
VDDWENGPNGAMPLVGALPAAKADDETDGAVEGELIELPRRSARGAFALKLGARISAQLTLRGIALLHEARSRVNVPDDLLGKCGIWETKLSDFMLAFGSHLESGQEEIVEGMAIVVHPEGP